MKHKLLVAFATLTALLSVGSANAWGGFGHRSIAYVAEQHLTPGAKAKCYYYLQHTLPYYASWMDYWRGVGVYRSVNNPHSMKASSDGRTLDWGGKPAGRVMGHLKNALEELGDGNYKNLPDSVVRQRLINMVHYVPDMHCPVHVGFPKEDFPEYRYTIYKNGKPIKYHGFWDGAPGFNRKGWTFEKYAAEVDKVSPKEAQKWTRGSLDDWASDIIKQAHRCYDITPAGTDVAELTTEQQNQVHALVDEMAMKAAYRLAYVLNTIFAE